MITYTLEKLPGGARVQINSGPFIGIHPQEHSFIDVETNGMVGFVLRGIQRQVNPAVDTVIIDESLVGGALHSYAPGTRTAKEIQADIMNVFNPSSNFLTP